MAPLHFPQAPGCRPRGAEQNPLGTHFPRGWGVRREGGDQHRKCCRCGSSEPPPSPPRGFIVTLTPVPIHGVGRSL